MALPIRYNVRNLRQRWKVTLLAIFGIALVVAAVVVIASMGAGFQAALRATGTDNNAIVTQRGSQSELTSWINIGNAQTIMTDPRIARDSDGAPQASCEIVVITSKPKKTDNQPTNITMRGVTPQAFKVRNGIKLVEGRMFEPGLFEVIAGKSILSFRRGDAQPNPAIKCFAFVQTYDEKPKRRLCELLQSQGLQMNQQIEVLSDGGDTVRDVQLSLSPEAEHLLDWFPLTMRLTTMTQSAKGLPDTIGDETPLPLRDEVLRQLERTKWFLWHGNVFQALQVLTSLPLDLEMASWERDEVRIGKVCKTVQEFYTFIDRNRAFIPNYGERYRSGERISTGFVASTLNQVVSKRMVKKQQRRWSHRGAHLLLQIRTRVLNGDWEDVFRRWYPGFRAQTQPVFA